MSGPSDYKSASPFPVYLVGVFENECTLSHHVQPCTGIKVKVALFVPKGKFGVCGMYQAGDPQQWASLLLNWMLVHCPSGKERGGRAWGRDVFRCLLRDMDVGKKDSLK